MNRMSPAWRVDGAPGDRGWLGGDTCILVDANVAMGIIEALVATQAEAYASGR